MSQKHTHTECNPSDMHPACPICKSDVFVEAEHALTPSQYDRLRDLMEAAPEKK